MKIKVYEGIQIYDELRLLKQEADINKTFGVMKLLEMKYITVNDLNLLLSKMESEGLIGSDTTDMIQKRIKK